MVAEAGLGRTVDHMPEAVSVAASVAVQAGALTSQQRLGALIALVGLGGLAVVAAAMLVGWFRSDDRRRRRRSAKRAERDTERRALALEKAVAAEAAARARADTGPRPLRRRRSAAVDADVDAATAQADTVDDPSGFTGGAPVEEATPPPVGDLRPTGAAGTAELWAVLRNLRSGTERTGPPPETPKRRWFRPRPKMETAPPVPGGDLTPLPADHQPPPTAPGERPMTADDTPAGTTGPQPAPDGSDGGTTGSRTVRCVPTGGVGIAEDPVVGAETAGPVPGEDTSVAVPAGGTEGRRRRWLWWRRPTPITGHGGLAEAREDGDAEPPTLDLPADAGGTDTPQAETVSPRSPGNWDTGNWDTGNWDTGNWDTGNWDTGNWDTGNWDTGNWDTGTDHADDPTAESFPTDNVDGTTGVEGHPGSGSPPADPSAGRVAVDGTPERTGSASDETTTGDGIVVDGQPPDRGEADSARVSDADWLSTAPLVSDPADDAPAGDDPWQQRVTGAQPPPQRPPAPGTDPVGVDRAVPGPPAPETADDRQPDAADEAATVEEVVDVDKVKLPLYARFVERRRDAAARRRDRREERRAERATERANARAAKKAARYERETRKDADHEQDAAAAALAVAETAARKALDDAERRMRSTDRGGPKPDVRSVTDAVEARDRAALRAAERAAKRAEFEARRRERALERERRAVQRRAERAARKEERRRKTDPKALEGNQAAETVKKQQEELKKRRRELEAAARRAAREQQREVRRAERARRKASKDRARAAFGVFDVPVEPVVEDLTADAVDLAGTSPVDASQSGSVVLTPSPASDITAMGGAPGNPAIELGRRAKRLLRKATAVDPDAEARKREQKLIEQRLKEQRKAGRAGFGRSVTNRMADRSRMVSKVERERRKTEKAAQAEARKARARAERELKRQQRERARRAGRAVKLGLSPVASVDEFASPTTATGSQHYDWAAEAGYLEWEQPAVDFREFDLPEALPPRKAATGR
jgi:hypothetical protein